MIDVKNPKEVLDIIVTQAMENYSRIQNLIETGRSDEIDIAAEMARDRQIAFALKGMMTYIHSEQVKLKSLDYAGK